MMLKYYLKEANPEDLYEKLEKNYPEILKSMKKEKYHIEYPKYGYINEIKFQEKTVGIVVLQKLKEVTMKYGLSEFYILPEHRNSENVMTAMLDLITAQNLELYIIKPSRDMVKNLINNNLAIPMSNDFIISSIPFVCTTDEIFENVHLKKYLQNIGNMNDEYLHISHYYSLKHGGMLFSMDAQSSQKDTNHLVISKPRKNDLKINLRRKLRKLTPEYLKNRTIDIILFSDIIIDAKARKDAVINKALDPDFILGSSEELSELLKELLKENNLTEKEGFKIRKDIKDALETGEIERKSIIRRLYYLIKHGSVKPISEELSLECPYCKSPVDYFLKNCISCGYSLENNRLFRSVEKVANRELEEADFIKLDDDKLQVNAIITDKLMNLIKTNDYNDEEVFEFQSRYVCYKIIKSLKNNFEVPHGEDLLNRLKEGCGLIYGIKHNYIELLSKEKYLEVLKNHWDREKIISEMELFKMTPEGESKKELISEIESQTDFEKFIENRFYPTDKGFELLKDSSCKFFEEKVDKKYTFYEFKKLWDSNIEKYEPEVIFELPRPYLEVEDS